ncbi:MAG: peptidoglycan DD-metalloendopeptidase family protein [Clostridiaceae bacterium]
MKRLLKHKFEILAFSLGVLVAVSVISYRLHKPISFSISKNGNVICYVSSKDEYTKALDEVLETLGEKFERIEIEENFTLIGNYESEKDTSTLEQTKDIILENIDGDAEGILIESDGVEIALAINEQEANDILENVKNYYIKSSGLEDISSADIVNDITYKSDMVPLYKFRDKEKEVSSIIKSNEEDSPILLIDFSGVKSEEVEVKPSQVTTWSDKYVMGTSVVENEGKSGIKEVSSKVEMKNGEIIDQVVVDENIIEEPETRVIAIGTQNPIIAGVAFLTKPSRGGITSYYGSRWGGFHKGVDIGSSYGSPIYAAMEGTITFAGWEGGYGYMVKINHGDGIETYYGHCSQLLVNAGDNVSKGEQIALVGSTGDSTGPHLHFEVRINGETVNPLEYIQ